MAVLESITYQVRIKKADGTYFYPPKSKVYEAPLEDLMDESTKRSAKGILNTSRIGTFPNLTLEVSYLGSQDMTTLLQLCRKLPMTIDYFDPEIGDYRRNVRVYAKTKTPTLLSQNPIKYNPLKISLTAYDPININYGV